MRKCDFNNRMTLRGADNINTVIAPSGYTRLSDLRISSIRLIRRPLEIFALQKIGVTVLKIGKSLDVFLRKRGMTGFKQGGATNAVILGQQSVPQVSKDIKWTLGSSPRVTLREDRLRVTGERKILKVTKEKKSPWMMKKEESSWVMEDEERSWMTISNAMTFIMWILVSSMSMTSTVRAECVPSPNCAEMGYTATSCDGDSLKCPFDLSKLYCIPCDTSFQHTCESEGQIGKGTSCNGKYQECRCNEGYDLVDGSCVISCAYTLTSLPAGCSAVSDTCVKNSTTYYSSTCTSCKNGYTINSGACKANTCSGYYSSKTGCSNYSTCQSGSATKYKCTDCNIGYTLSSGQCSANTCSGYKDTIPDACSSYNTCITSDRITKYSCTSCQSNYTLNRAKMCIDTYCYNEFYNNSSLYIEQDLVPKAGSSYIDCNYTCTGTNGIEYWGGLCME